MKRILFVDDQRQVLDGLQRMLHPCRKQWDMTFANSGSEALSILAAKPYDVIVSDMRMPGMDGAQLLGLVRDRYPGMIRIVLSGQFETEAAMRAVPVAHQFLTKPCDPGKLRAVIESFCEADSMLGDGPTRRVIAAIGELPALPRTYAALVAALNAPETSLDHVAAIVESDLAVAAKVLQLVNSAFFGLAHEVATVSTAVGYLGFDVLKQLVLTVELFRTFSCDGRVAGFSAEEVQRHSRRVASIAAQLPQPRQHAAAISVAALLHDVGKLILSARFSEQFERALKTSLAQNRPLYLMEEEQTGTSHAKIGAYLLGLWGLPPIVVDAVSGHHHPAPKTADKNIDVTWAVHIADRLEHEAQARRGTSAATDDNIDKDLSCWSDLLPEWREAAQEIVETENSL